MLHITQHYTLLHHINFCGIFNLIIIMPDCLCIDSDFSVLFHMPVKDILISLCMMYIRLPDGLCRRGDINLLLLGDPGTAKSQLLKFVENCAPICVSVCNTLLD